MTKLGNDSFFRAWKRFGLAHRFLLLFPGRYTPCYREATIRNNLDASAASPQKRAPSRIVLGGLKFVASLRLLRAGRPVGG